MKKVVIFSLVLLLFFLSVNCVIAESIDLSGYSDAELMELKKSIDIEIARRNEENGTEQYMIELDDCLVLVKNVTLVNHLNKPTLVVQFEFTNYSNDEAFRFDDVFFLSAFQNGIQIYVTDSVAEFVGINDGGYNFIKSGATIETVRGFELIDLLSPVEIDVYGKISRIRHNGQDNELIKAIFIPIPN